MTMLSVFFKSRSSDGFYIYIWFSGTSLFDTEISRIGVCRLFSVDKEVSLRIDELILHEFIEWFCEGPCCLLSVTFGEL